jgi:hypothetical protein
MALIFDHVLFAVKIVTLLFGVLFFISSIRQEGHDKTESLMYALISFVIAVLAALHE